MTLKFNGFKAKRNFHTILNFVFFQKYEMYENKYCTKICDFTVACADPLFFFLWFWSVGAPLKEMGGGGSSWWTFCFSLLLMLMYDDDVNVPH